MDDPGLVPVIHPLRLMLDAIKPEHAAGFIFVNRINGAIDLDNLADRVIMPIVESNQMEWEGWQAYRRGLVTNLRKLGVEDTAVQLILRREHVRTISAFPSRPSRRRPMKRCKSWQKKSTVRYLCTRRLSSDSYVLDFMEPTNGLEPLTC
ncbi:hypothetical protein [Bryocella elongata]|uniref:hypothetical protein n=1 Tax=Bryocella elongata TaxID=863522 RepID=UPI0013579D13|nr:hypothetical protein [Bryocella elongata]